jgi:putative endopeptidase
MTESSGIELDELDPNIRPQDDLFRHANQKWIDRTEIPADKARYGSFYLLHEEAEKAVREIIVEAQGPSTGSGTATGSETATGSGTAMGSGTSMGSGTATGSGTGAEERKVGDLYTSFMDEDRIEQLGATPLSEDLALVASVRSIPDLLQVIGSLERAGTSGFLQAFVDNDPGNPERYLVFLEQGGIGLPDESYFREDSFAAIRTAYRDHLERMFALAGLDDAGARADRVFELETAIASHHWDNVASRDSEKTYNLKTWADVVASAGPSAGSGPSTGSGTADLNVWLDAMGAPDGSFAEVVVRQPEFIEGLGALLTDARVDAWRDWLAWQVIRSRAAYLSSDFVEANFDFYGRTLTGTPQIRERWKRGVSLVEGAMGEAVGRIYVERHFPAESKEAMDVLVANLIEAYRRSITALDWMGAETRERALEKLEKFTPKIGYPVKWRDYSALGIRPDDLIANVKATSEYEFNRELGKIGKPLDRDEWFMTPQTVNAYYNPGFNEIVFPAAILQLPFFSPDREAAANYGAIGAVIGHEIGHGFDDQGSRFDGDGRLTDWWTEADRVAFEERTSSLIAQYDALAPAQVPDHHVNGALTIGENIGDLGGLAIAWKAYLLSLEGAEPPVIDGLTGAQRFYLSWAQSWQLKARDEEIIRLLAIDPHSPSEFRCNQIVRNIDEFYEAFDVTDADALWLPEDERVTIW